MLPATVVPQGPAAQRSPHSAHTVVERSPHASWHALGSGLWLGRLVHTPVLSQELPVSQWHTPVPCVSESSDRRRNRVVFPGPRSPCSRPPARPAERRELATDPPSGRGDRGPPG